MFFLDSFVTVFLMIFFFVLNLVKLTYVLDISVSPAQNLSSLTTQEHQHAILHNSSWPHNPVNETYFQNFCPASTECEFTRLSCRFLRQLTNLTEGNILMLKTFSDRGEALQAVKVIFVKKLS
jgi:hypothetical protein